MKVSTSQVTKLTITGVPNMDPIAVIAEDFGQGVGKITITCFGEAWTHYWGHMGEQHTMRSFFLKCDTPYLIDKLKTGIRGQIADDDDDALVKILCKRVIERRRSGDLTLEVARYMWDDCQNANFGDHENLCAEVLGGDWRDYMPRKSNPEYEHMGKIVDTVKAAFALESLQQEEAA